MAHFAIACPESPGHMNPMTTLLLELQRRGHRITWIGFADASPRLQACGFQSIVIGDDEFPAGTYERVVKELGRLSGIAAGRFTIDVFRRAIMVGLRDCPAVIRDCDATAIIADESIFSAGSISEATGLPCVTICNALPIHPDPHLPPNGLAWKYGTTSWHRLRNQFGNVLFRGLLGSIHRLIREYRRENGLPKIDLLHENASRLATIAQIAEEFDYPRVHRPSWIHYVGSLHDLTVRPAVEFPFELLDGRPLIYASMGTAQNQLSHVFRTIAEACWDLPAQLVISLGGGSKPESMGRLPGNPIVVEFAPQLELIRRASLVITHAGMNTASESIAYGVPMVAIPVTNDQPAVAARIAWSGCGETIPLSKVTVARLSSVVRKLLSDDRYRIRAKELAAANERAGGVGRAADIIESVVE